jgi:hypothetical protein
LAFIVQVARAFCNREQVQQSGGVLVLEADDAAVSTVALMSGGSCMKVFGRTWSRRDII